MVCPDVGASRFDRNDERDIGRGDWKMRRKTGSAITSVLQMGEHDGARDRVLRATFWLPVPTDGCAEPTRLDTARARREPT